MRTFSTLHSLCVALLSIALVAHAQDAVSNTDEPVAPLVLPEVKALPALSFRGPFPEGSKIGGFEVTGQAARLATSPDFIRLTPPIPLSNGAIFSTSAVKSKEWIVEVALRIHGSGRQGGTKGGRGFGFWYTKSGSPTKGQQPAGQAHNNHDSKLSFFGQSINFDGLGVIFDAAASAPLLPRSDPAGWAFGADTTGVISAVIDDGKTGNKWYDENYKSGEKRQAGQEAKYLENSVGECEAAFRNAPGLVWVRIAHFNKMIRVDLDLQPHTTLLPEKRHFTHHCFTINDVSLPSGYHFGLTALSAGNTDPDSVDVYAFDAWEVTGAADGQQHSQPVIDKVDATSFKPLAGTEESGEEASVGNLQGIIAAQMRMTEAIDALARRIDVLQSKLDRPSSAISSGSDSQQLKDIAAALSRLTGETPAGSQSGATAEEIEQQSVQYLVKMMTRLSADVNGISVRLDSLATRVNKNIGALMNRITEVFTVAARTEKVFADTSAKKRGLNFVGATKWTGGLVGCLVVFVGVDRWRRNRSGSGGRGRKMI